MAFRFTFIHLKFSKLMPLVMLLVCTLNREALEPYQWNKVKKDFQIQSKADRHN